jgi:pantoate--beta-alanine ligase
MRTVRTIRELRQLLEPLRAGSIALVPTMGAYHAGHLALFATARKECETVVASLFVNPAQFGAGEDLALYPRDEQRDRELAAGAGVDFLFAPPDDELYPAGFDTWVDLPRLGNVLEGEFRPGHFRGVATVCVKLFNIVRPRRAYFGEKDGQQAAVLAQVVRDLDLELELRVVPTVRDADGLALSSRNVRLSPADRRAALALPRALDAGRAAYLDGRDAVEAARGVLNGLRPDYVEAVRFDGRLVLAAAVRVSGTRLIDNVTLADEGAAT